MKIVFFGTSEFAVNSLISINHSNHEVLCVVTQPDSRRDRGHKLHYSPVKEKAIELGLPIYQTDHINDGTSEKFLKDLKADIFVVVSYGSLLKNNILTICENTPINIHPSLLPKYRGAAPIQRTLMSGDDTTGVTIMEMVEKLDAGDIILQKTLSIESNWNYGDLSGVLSTMGSYLVVEALNQIENGDYETIPQDEELHSYAKKIRNEEKYINLNQDSEIIVNTIRGLTPKLTPMVLTNGTYLGILYAENAGGEYFDGEIGEVLRIEKKKGILVKCKTGAIWLKELKPEGKNAMSFLDYVNGKKINVGDILESKEGK